MSKAKKIKPMSTTVPVRDKIEKEISDENVKAIVGVNLSEVDVITEDIKKRLAIGSDILSLFPEIELNVDIFISLLLNPNFTTERFVNYKFKNRKMVPSEVRTLLGSKIEEYVEDTYKLSEKLEDIVKESLYTKGAYIEVQLPPENIYQLYKKYKKDLKQSNESLSVTDSILPLYSEVVEKIEKDVGIVSKYNDLTPAVESLLVAEGMLIFDEEVNDIDKPIVKKIKTEHVIPIADKHDPSMHYGYFIVLDDKNNIMSNNMDPMMAGVDINKTIAEAKKVLSTVANKPPVLKNLDDFKDVIIKQKIIKQLNGKINKSLEDINFEISNDLLYNILRKISKREGIKIMYLPKELVSYYAVDFRENGTGRSLFEKISILISLKAMILFTELMSFIKSSITTTDVKVDLDPNDPEYKKHMKMIMSEIIRNRQTTMPIGILKVDSIVDWLHKVGFAFTFKHPKLPDINIEVEEKTFDIKPVDSDIKEYVDKMITLAMFLTPEIVDNSQSPDFATTVAINNNLLMARVLKKQRQYERLLTIDIKKKLIIDTYFRQSIKGVLLDKINEIRKYKIRVSDDIKKEMIKKLTDDELLDLVITEAISNLYIDLPKPEGSEESDNVNDKLSKFNDLLDTIIDNLISTDVLPDDLVGEIGDKVDDIKGAIKLILRKDFVIDNNILPEFNKLITLDEDGRPMLDILTEFNNYTEVLSKIILPFVKANKKQQETIDKKLDKIENGEDNEEDNNGEENNTDEESNSEDNNEESENNEESNTENKEEESKDNDNKENGEEDTEKNDNEEPNFNF